MAQGLHIQQIDMTEAPKFKIGDTIYWYCDEEQRVHHAKVDFVNCVQERSDRYLFHLIPK